MADYWKKKKVLRIYINVFVNMQSIEVSNVSMFFIIKERLDVSEILIDSKNRIRLFGKRCILQVEINGALIQNNILSDKLG